MREEIEEADDPARLRALRDACAAQAEALVERLGAAFDGGDLEAAAALVVRLTYVTKARAEIDSKCPHD